MAVAFDASSESHTGTTASTSEASFSWTHTPVGTPAGVYVFTFSALATTTTDAATGVTYNGVALESCKPLSAYDTASEPCIARVWRHTGIPSTGAQSVVVTRLNDTTRVYAVCVTVTAGTTYTDIHWPGIVTLAEDQALAQQSVTDGSPGTNSLRLAGAFSGGASPAAAGANTTLAQSIDLGNYGCSVGYETTAGQGARNVGFTAASDDVAAVHFAVKESASAPGTIPTTWDPVRKNTNLTLSNANLTATAAAALDRSAFGTLSRSSGKYIISFTGINMATNDTEFLSFGFANASEISTNYVGQSVNSVGPDGSGGVFINNSATGRAGPSIADSDTLDIVFDITNELWWHRIRADNNWNGTSADPVAGTGGFDISGLAAGPFVPMMGVGAAGETCTIDGDATGHGTSLTSWNGTVVSSPTAALRSPLTPLMHILLR